MQVCQDPDFCIFILHIRSSMEYCSVAWYDILTQIQRNAIERLQIVLLKIILGKDCPIKEDGHFDYDRALSLFNLQSLFSRREKKMLDFGRKCVKHPSLKMLLPFTSAIEDCKKSEKVPCQPCQDLGLHGLCNSCHTEKTEQAFEVLPPFSLDFNCSYPNYFL